MFPLRVLIVLILLGVLIGCGSLKANQGQDSGFIQDYSKLQQDKNDRYPFQRGWASAKWRRQASKYSTIHIPPINTKHVVDAGWWRAQNAKTREQLEKDLLTIATYMHGQVVAAYRETPNGKFTVVDQPQENSIVLELALIELTPAKAYFNSTVTAIGLLALPGTGMAALAGRGSVAMEGRVRDGATGEVLVLFADRELDKSSPVGLSKFTWYYGSKQNIDDWAIQLVELSNTPQGTGLKDESRFTLKPW